MSTTDWTKRGSGSSARLSAIEREPGRHEDDDGVAGATGARLVGRSGEQARAAPDGFHVPGGDRRLGVGSIAQLRHPSSAIPAEP